VEYKRERERERKRARISNDGFPRTNGGRGEGEREKEVTRHLRGFIVEISREQTEISLRYRAGRESEYRSALCP